MVVRIRGGAYLCRYILVVVVHTRGGAYSQSWVGALTEIGVLETGIIIVAVDVSAAVDVLVDVGARI